MEVSSPPPNQHGARNRIRYARVKDIGTRIADIKQRNIKIITNAKPLPEGNRLPGRVVYWFVTTEEVTVAADPARFIQQEKLQVDSDNGVYYLNQYNFTKNNAGAMIFNFPDGSTETVTTCNPPRKPRQQQRQYSNEPTKESANEQHLVYFFPLDPTQEQAAEESIEANNPNLQNIEYADPNPLSVLDTPPNETRMVNTLLLVPGNNNYIESAKKALSENGFEENASADRMHLYSKKTLTKGLQHILLVQYGKLDMCDRIRDCLKFSSEAVLLVETDTQISPVQAVSCMTNVHGDNTESGTCRLKVKTKSLPLGELNHSKLGTEARLLFGMNDLQETFLGCLSYKKGTNSDDINNSLAEFLAEWNFTEPVNFTAENIYLCFKYMKNTSALTPFAEKTLEVLGIRSDALAVHGSVLVYVRCPAHAPWHILLHEEEIFNTLKNDQLVEIYEAFICDVDASLQQPNNADFVDELNYLKELMIVDGIPFDRKPDRFRRVSEEPRERLVPTLENCALFITRAEINYNAGDYLGALNDYNVANELKPNNPSTLCNRGVTKRMLDDYTGALEDLNNAYKLNPNNSFTLKCRGDTKRLMGDYKGALLDLNEADRLRAGDAFTLRNRGAVKLRLNDASGSLEDLNRADKIQPNNPATLKYRGDTKRMLGDLKGALEDLNRSNNLQPNDAITLRHRGDTKRMLNDLKGALDDLNRANEIQPNNPFTLKCRGATKRMLGDFNGALLDLNIANQLQPNDEFTILQKERAMQQDARGESPKNAKASDRDRYPLMVLPSRHSQFVM